MTDDLRSDGATPRVGVIMTAHNRRNVTQACLVSIAGQDQVDPCVVLTDDGSTDGTRDMARSFAFVTVISGSGSDYWAGGMRRAWERIDLDSVDYLALVNDDVVLDSDALPRLVQCAVINPDALWGGSVRDPQTGVVTYGGNRRTSSYRYLKLERAEPADVPVECDTLNGNVLLMSTKTARVLGGIDGRYVHGMADYDLSWRGKSLGIPSMLAPGTYGTCRPNDIHGTWRDVRLGRRERWKKLRGPKGLPPRLWFHVCRTYGGPLWVVDFAAPYIRVAVGR